MHRTGQQRLRVCSARSRRGPVRVCTLGLTRVWPKIPIAAGCAKIARLEYSMSTLKLRAGRLQLAL